jgi:hypothetical protein
MWHYLFFLSTVFDTVEVHPPGLFEAVYGNKSFCLNLYEDNSRSQPLPPGPAIYRDARDNI